MNETSELLDELDRQVDVLATNLTVVYRSVQAQATLVARVAAEAERTRAFAGRWCAFVADGRALLAAAARDADAKPSSSVIAAERARKRARHMAEARAQRGEDDEDDEDDDGDEHDDGGNGVARDDDTPVRRRRH